MKDYYHRQDPARWARILSQATKETTAMSFLKDFVRLIFGLPDEEPVSTFGAVATVILVAFICFMLAIFAK